MKAATVVAKGEEIARARIYKGMSINILAERSGLSVSAIYKIENRGGQTVRPLSAQKICSALDVSFETLFDIVGSNAVGEQS